MTDLHFTLLTDGPFDRVLLRPLVWLLRQLVCSEISLQGQWADLRSVRQKPVGLANRIRTALDLYPADLLFVHRDAEKDNPALRHAEIAHALNELDIPPPPVVAVVPVRMTEAWLLFDEDAVRRAADNPNGRQPISVPVGTPDDSPNPKQLFYDALRTASGLSGRRLAKFTPSSAAHRVAEYIDDYSPLRSLAAFARLERDLATVINQHAWH